MDSPYVFYSVLINQKEMYFLNINFQGILNNRLKLINII